MVKIKLTAEVLKQVQIIAKANGIKLNRANSFKQVFEIYKNQLN